MPQMVVTKTVPLVGVGEHAHLPLYTMVRCLSSLPHLCQGRRQSQSNTTRMYQDLGSNPF